MDDVHERMLHRAAVAVHPCRRKSWKQASKTAAVANQAFRWIGSLKSRTAPSPLPEAVDCQRARRPRRLHERPDGQRQQRPAGRAAHGAGAEDAIADTAVNRTGGGPVFKARYSAGGLSRASCPSRSTSAVASRSSPRLARARPGRRAHAREGGRRRRDRRHPGRVDAGEEAKGYGVLAQVARAQGLVYRADRRGVATGAARVALRCDVTDRAESQTLARVVAELGSVDVLVNNAATLTRCPAGGSSAPELWERDLRVNLTGAFNCAQAVWPGMIERGWGRS